MANTPLKRPGVWGIDLGQCALKAIRLEDVEGEIRATAFDYIEHPKILSQPDADPDQLTREALEKFLSRNDLKGDTVAISVPGQSGLARFVKLPPVDEKKIPDIVRFEAKQQIPFPLEEVVWAYQRLGTGTVTDGMVLDTEIGLFAMKRDMVNRYLQHFKDVNVEVHFVQMAPLALCNFLSHDQLGKGAVKRGAGDDEEEAGDKSCVVALDIGADNSNLVITDGEKIIWQRPIPLGGNHFTRALTKDLKLTFAKAEHLKRNAVKSPDLKKILAALKPVLNDFVSEVQRSLGYFTNTHRDASIQYMLGLGNAFRLPGLQKYLQEKLQLEVRKLAKIERLAGDEPVTEAPQYNENVLSFAVAHGLALQGLSATRLHTNLLPPEIQRERFVRAKKPWAVAAAAVLLMLSPPLMIGYAAQQRAWARKENVDALSKLEATSKAAAQDASELETLKKKVDDAVKSTVILRGGEEERTNWLQFNTVLDEALPRPGGGRMVETANSNNHPDVDYFKGEPKEGGIAPKEAWGGPSGKEAWQQYQEIRRQLALADQKSRPKLEEEQNKQNKLRMFLAQVNIEGIEMAYSDNLPGDFFSKLTKHELHGMRGKYRSAIWEKDKSAKLPKTGWVVEIRGYTYHWGQKQFVLDTLVDNLNYLAVAGAKAAFPSEDGKDKKMVSLPPDAERILFKGGKADPKDEDNSRLSYIFLYDYEVDYKARGSEFIIIGKSVLPRLLSLGGGGPGEFGKGPVGPVGPPTGSPKGGDPKEKDDPNAGEVKQEGPNRGAWKPPSNTGFADLFTGSGTGAPGGFGGPGPDRIPGKGMVPPGGKEGVTPGGKQASPGASQLPPRTEFVILLVWQEPLTAESSAGPGAPPAPVDTPTKK
jgi:type IV pilus assembly protein PilM